MENVVIMLILVTYYLFFSFFCDNFIFIYQIMIVGEQIFCFKTLWPKIKFFFLQNFYLVMCIMKLDVSLMYKKKFKQKSPSHNKTNFQPICCNACLERLVYVECSPRCPEQICSRGWWSKLSDHTIHSPGSRTLDRRRLFSRPNSPLLVYRGLETF